ncbi:ankyrin repeat domain-containing protein [Helicobacter cholecystus]|uniref:ankyrin repeat domain-containing protein n=1 Tax=Helicobacter cholecystus TaxID=45498 RepID=UPI000F832085|nr:ankyrin repeat domain-containing protein [Helicobacter cholecystus]
MMTTTQKITEEEILDAYFEDDIEFFKTHQISGDYRIADPDFNGDTLFLASLSDPKCELYAYFLEQGVDLFATNSLKENVFHAAVFSDDPQRLKKILKSNPKCIKMLNDQEKEGDTPLHFSVMFKSRSYFDLLIELGADVNITHIKGYTPLSTACCIPFEREEDNLHIVKTLIKHGANPSLKTNAGIYPLAAAINNDLHSVAQLLWEYQYGKKSPFNISKSPTPKES